MFDYVKVEPPQKCIKCGAELNSWQSKDLECTMAEVPFWRVSNFYCSCRKCNTWHEYVLKDHGEKPLSDYRLMIGVGGARRWDLVPAENR